VASASAAASSEQVNMGRLATSLRQLQHDLAATSTRPVDRELAASVINEVRRHNLHAHADSSLSVAASNQDLIKGISDEHFNNWMKAIGLQPSDVEAMRRAAFMSGLGNPLGSDLSNALSYIAAPLAGAAASTSLAALAVGGIATLAAPALNSYFQSGVITRLDMIRERNGPTVNLVKTDVHDQLTLKQAATKVREHTETFSAACEAFHTAQQGHGSTALRHDQLVELAEKVCSTSQALCAAQQDALMTQGSHGRQLEGNLWQTLPRTLRPLGAALPGLGTSDGTVGRPAVYGAMAAASWQSGAALGVAFAHHYTAGRDERNKQNYNAKLFMLYGDVFTEAGKTKVGRGEAVSGQDIDEGKLRNLITSPSQAFVARVQEAIKFQQDKLKPELEKLEGPDLELGQPGQQASAATLSDEDARKLQQLTAQSAALRADLNHLKAGTLDQLPQGSPAHKLITESLEHFFSPLLKASLEKKYATKGEFTSQLVQRLAQALHMGVFGTAAASMISRVSSSVVGGASHASNAQIGSVAAVSSVMAYVGASYQGVASSWKNHKRYQNDTVSAGQQFCGGATAVVNENVGNFATKAAVGKAHKAIESEMQRQTIQNAAAIVADAKAAAALLDELGRAAI
jgi:hypothetical protein